MSHENHTWKLGKAPPIVRPHSLAKHRVLARYLAKYVATLTGNPKQDILRLTLVDGFAGGGLYRDQKTGEERPGSPLIMLNAMKEAEAIARSVRSKPFKLDARFFFVERNDNARDFLAQTIAASEFSPLIGNSTNILAGDVIDNVANIIADIKARGRAGRTIFFLDQFGWIAVPFPEIRRILTELPNAEVILTFATDSLIDYLGNDEQTQRNLERVGLSLPSATIATAKQQSDWRRTIQFALHREIHVKSGAKKYTPFFIRSEDAHRDYWLIHLSGHRKARDVMVGLHWDMSTSFAHYGGAGFGMLGYEQERDSSLTGQPFLPGFFFDQTARELTTDALREQFPERVSSFKQGIAFEELLDRFSNDTPADSSIMGEVLCELAESGEIVVKDVSGSIVRRRKTVKSGDIIVPSRQRRLFLPRR